MSGSGAASRPAPGSDALQRRKSRLATPEKCSRHTAAASNCGDGDGNGVLRGPGPCGGCSDTTPRAGDARKQRASGFFLGNKGVYLPERFFFGFWLRVGRSPAAGSAAVCQRGHPAPAWPSPGRGPAALSSRRRAEPHAGGAQPLAFFGIKLPAPVSSL